MLSAVAQLSNTELLARVAQLAQREREATTSLIAHLAELDARRLYLAEGCSSLFTYCTQLLHLSEHAAYGRIEAARAARRFPIILERLGGGSVTLTTVGLLAAHLTSENHRDLLDIARHTSKRQVEELVARLRPQPPVPASVRRLPTAGHTPASPTARERAATGPEPAGDAHGVASPPLSSPAPAPPPARPAVVAPLAPERYRVQFTASAETLPGRRSPPRAARAQVAAPPPARGTSRPRSRARSGSATAAGVLRSLQATGREGGACVVLAPDRAAAPAVGAGDHRGNSVRTEYGPGPLEQPCPLGERGPTSRRI